jgi:hypothetical protein
VFVAVDNYFADTTTRRREHRGKPVLEDGRIEARGRDLGRSAGSRRIERAVGTRRQEGTGLPRRRHQHPLLAEWIPASLVGALADLRSLVARGRRLEVIVEIHVPPIRLDKIGTRRAGHAGKF